MKYVLPLVFLAGPALAHTGTHAHAHPHGAEAWIVGLVLFGFAVHWAVAAMRRK